ncbi:hypothetical protein ACLPJK_26250 [Pseudomonas aeruginosa]|uniref:hypothetical protein n=1 Tax=Pseudomonas aeruginosa TaxID=287 RepID=UPI003D278C5B
MGTAIDQRMIPAGDDFYYTQDFAVFVESYLTHLRNHETTTRVDVARQDAWVYRYNLHFYLLDRGIAFNRHHLILRMNNFTTPRDFNENTTSLLLPDDSYVSSLVRIYRSSIGSITGT